MNNDASVFIQRGDSMKVTMTSNGNFKKTTRFLTRLSHYNPRPIMTSTGRNLVSSLHAATPVRTGETANGWKFKVEKTRNGYEMYVYNTAHPETGTNVARLLDVGHGTRNGGYIPGRHYIKPATHGLLIVGSNQIKKAVSK